MKTEINALNK